MGREAVTAVRHQVPEILDRSYEGERIQTRKPVTVETEGNDSCDQPARTAQDPSVRPLPRLMQAAPSNANLKRLDAMTRQVKTLQASQPIDSLLRVFDRDEVAVVLDGEEFMGLITRVDLINHLRLAA